MSDIHDNMIARWSHVQSSLFPFMREELDPCTEALERLIIVLDTIGLEAYVPSPPSGGRGRKPDDRRALARAFIAKAMFSMPTTVSLIERLAVDKSLRRICGWETRREVPSESTFSRAFEEFAQGELPVRMHEALIKRSLGDRVIGCVARDSTEIEAREKPAKNDDPPPPSPTVDPPRKRGRPRKGEERPSPSPTRLERQVSQSVAEMLNELPTECDVGSKKNSKGYKETWIGYKLHIDVADGQIPVACLLTSASVHDSQAAIPLMTITGQRITYLYDLMDSAYDAAGVIDHSRFLGHVPIVDRNFRAATDIKVQHEAEIKRREFIHQTDPDRILYRFRTMVERINARLKDEFGGRFVRVRGAIKVKCHLMFGMLALTVDQILRALRTEPRTA
ncbi:MAG: transposase [Rhodospirillaceae bacterium]